MERGKGSRAVRWGGVVMGKTVNHFHNCAEFDLPSTTGPGSSERVCVRVRAARTGEMKGKRTGVKFN